MATIKGTAKGETLRDTSSDARSFIYGLDGNDTLHGQAGSDDLFGDNGNDVLYGGIGDDWLYGGLGADRHDGGSGFDGASYFNATAGVRIALDRSFAAAGEAIGDTFVSIENLRGADLYSNRLAGNASANFIMGGNNTDTLYGRSGDDTLKGFKAVDRIYGESGNDWLVGGGGADYLSGGNGIDGVSYVDSSVRITVSLDGSLTASGEAIGDDFSSIEKLEGSYAGGDTLAGSSSRNAIWGYDQADKIFGRGGNDELFGGQGNDTLHGEGGDDILFGEQGADILNGGSGEDLASYYSSTGVTVSLDGSLAARGDAVGDTFISVENLTGSNTGSDSLAGNEGVNFFYSLGGNDKLYGRGGDDNLGGGSGADTLNGGDGLDLASYYYEPGVTVALDGSLVATGDAVGDRFIAIEGLEGSQNGSDKLAGNEAVNDLYGKGGNDTLYGRGGNDRMYGGADRDTLYGEAGDDSLQGGAGGDRLSGGAGKDLADYSDSAKGIKLALDGSLSATGDAVGDTFSSIEGITGSDTGNDFLRGDSSVNEIHGNGGNDIIDGRGGDDRLAGDEGTDTLTGGAGNDVFWFFFVNGGADTITDFAAGDQIEFEIASFTGLSAGSLTAEQFVNGAGHAAGTDLVRVLFDTDDNTLWYDADGSGAAAAVKLATFTNGYQGLSAADFILSE